MTDSPSAEWFAKQLSQRTKWGIMIGTSTLIRSGTLKIGVKLPPIRDVAFFLGVSPTTVADAWRELRRQKLITGLGRNGSWVSGDYVAIQPERLLGIGDTDKNNLNLSKAIPDPALFPPLERVFSRAVNVSGLNGYDRINIIPELKQVAKSIWPYEAEAFMATNGGYDAIYSVLKAFVTPGSYIAVEDPTSLRFIDILETLNAQPLPIACDSEGPIPEVLAAALEMKPAVFLFQPRLHAITGQTVTERRMKELSRTLKDTYTLIIEDDGMNDISSSAPLSLGQDFPDRVVHVRSFSKTLGPDLRIAVLSSAKKLVDELHSFRSFGAGWTSRIIQAATAELLTDPATQVYVEKARRIYSKRRTALSQALVNYGVSVPSGNGFCLWVPVRSDQSALRKLAESGIVVQPGSNFSFGSTNYIRIATSRLKSNYDYIAGSVYKASKER